MRAGRAAGMDTEMVVMADNGRTATYTAFLDSDGDCKFGVGDMDIHSMISPEYLRSKEAELAKSEMLICDGNLSESSIHTLMEICNKHSVPFFFDPADLSKATKPLTSTNIRSVSFYSSPNLNELNSMLSTLPSSIPAITSITAVNVGEKVVEIAEASKQLLEHYNMTLLLVTLSEHGVVIVRKGRPEDPLMTSSMTTGVSGVWYPCSDPCTQVVSVSGAGDCLTAGFITAALQGRDQASAVSGGMQAARLSCSVSAAVPDNMRLEDIDWTRPADKMILF